jgi:glucose-6-phosphate isomerase
VVWGEPGTNGQHAYFQMLHQGDDDPGGVHRGARSRRHGLADQHAKLLANCLAQSQALMLGKTAEAGAGRARHRQSRRRRPRCWRATAPSPATARAPRCCCRRSRRAPLGALVGAVRSTGCSTSGALWGINSFDQWGVELGKALCNALLPRLASGDVTGPGRVHRRAAETAFGEAR